MCQEPQLAGGALEPFVKLFNATEKEKRIDIPCIVVTD
jgi:putative ATP-dependent endonuclease of OLD family